MEWQTHISTHKDGEVYIRGQRLLDLIERHTFTEGIYLLLRGTLPSDTESQMLDAVLVAVIEHSVAVPSAFVPRTVVSTGNPMNAAMAAGALAIGEHHGGAIEKAMEVLQSEVEPKMLVQQKREDKERIAGFGHKLYKDKDPRAEALFKKARDLGLSDTYLKRAENIGTELEEQSGKQLPLNVDGAIAAILVTLGFDATLGKAFFVLGRMPGMVAHAHEELMNEKPYRRLDDEDITYVGD